MSVMIRTGGESWRMVPVADIQPYDRNAKIHGPEQVERLRASLQEFGFVRPLLVDDRIRLIAGHGMLEAAKAEGMEQVPCVVVSGLTDAQRRAYVHADNKLPELDALGIDMSNFGFELPEAVDFEPFDGEGDGGGSQVSDGDKFRVVLGALMFDLPDKDHSLYELSRTADADAVAAQLRRRLRGMLAGGAK